MARSPAALPHWPIGQGQPPAGRFVATVPGESAPLLPVPLPPGLRGPARRAVGERQLRDRLGEPAARLDLRPAILGTGPDGWAAMLAADRGDLSRWRAALGAALPRARALLPDYLALPAAPALWTLATWPDGRIGARLGPADGFAAEGELAALLLARARARGPAPRAVWLIGPDPPAPVAAALEGLPRARTAADLPAGLAPPRALALGEAGLDLRDDPGLAAQRLAARLRALALPAALALAGAGAWAGALALQTADLRRQAEGIATRTLSALRAGLIPDGPILDITLQTERALDARRAAAGPGGPGGLDLLRATAQGLADAGVIPQSLGLAQGGAVAVDLVLPGFAALDAALMALAARGLEVEVQRRVGTGAGQVTAALILRGAAP